MVNSSKITHMMINTGENKQYDNDDIDDSMLDKGGRWASTWQKEWFGMKQNGLISNILCGCTEKTKEQQYRQVQIDKTHKAVY
jgi:hypothetical protein